MDLSFYHGKRVLVTGHTGFKGSWLCKVLEMNGAEVVGYALSPVHSGLFEYADIERGMNSVIGDIRSLPGVIDVVSRFCPEIVIHMAAQPIVTESYHRPVYTYETNVMGTVNVCEAMRRCGGVRSSGYITLTLYGLISMCWSL